MLTQLVILRPLLLCWCFLPLVMVGHWYSWVCVCSSALMTVKHRLTEDTNIPTSVLRTLSFSSVSPHLSSDYPQPRPPGRAVNGPSAESALLRVVFLEEQKGDRRQTRPAEPFISGQNASQSDTDGVEYTHTAALYRMAQATALFPPHLTHIFIQHRRNNCNDQNSSRNT